MNMVIFRVGIMKSFSLSPQYAKWEKVDKENCWIKRANW